MSDVFLLGGFSSISSSINQKIICMTSPAKCDCLIIIDLRMQSEDFFELKSGIHNHKFLLLRMD